ncbi:AMP-binding protein [soil metagenome]
MMAASPGEAGMTARARRIHEIIAANAADDPSRLAVIEAGGRRVSRGAYGNAVDAAAGLLRANGVQPGDRVMIVAENCLAAAAFVFAAGHLDAVAVPVNARLTPAELARVVDHAAPRIAVYTGAVSPEAAAHAASAGAAPHRLGAGQVEIAVLGPSDPEAVPPGREAVAVILYTTGTTGAPKGVMLTHGNLLFAGRASGELRRLGPQDRVYGVLPLTHVFGLASMLVAAAHAGAEIELATRFKPDRLLAALRGGVTVFPAVPQMHALLMQHTGTLGIARLEESRLRYVSSGAAPLDPAWKRKAETFYRLALQNGYGMTESTAGICGTRNPLASPDTSVGPPLPGVEIRIEPARGSSDGTGEILTRGPHVMKGYYRDAAGTAAAIGADGFLRTGDLGRIDGAGSLHVVGRCKELIIRSGFNVYPPEVEAALTDHPAVVQSAVIGRRLEGGNEEVLAFVECADPASVDVEALQAFLAARLASYKRPSRIILTDRLPAAATGKVLKHKLLDAFAGELAQPGKTDRPR